MISEYPLIYALALELARFNREYQAKKLKEAMLELEEKRNQYREKVKGYLKETK